MFIGIFIIKKLLYVYEYGFKIKIFNLVYLFDLYFIRIMSYTGCIEYLFLLIFVYVIIIMMIVNLDKILGILFLGGKCGFLIFVMGFFL